MNRKVLSSQISVASRTATTDRSLSKIDRSIIAPLISLLLVHRQLSSRDGTAFVDTITVPKSGRDGTDAVKSRRRKSSFARSRCHRFTSFRFSFSTAAPVAGKQASKDGLFVVIGGGGGDNRIE